MPRKPRKYIIAPYSLYHIVTRGNNQRRIFRSPRDYKKFLKIIEETKKKFPFYLYSLNLLSNHYHFELETKEVPISKIMHQINTSYVKYFRKRYGGSGHLFQERFFSSLINKDSYFWEVSAYIDLNAARAGLVEKPEDWPWSSYLIYIKGKKKEKLKLIEKLIDKERFLRYGGEDLEKVRFSYLKFIEERLKSKKEPPFPIKPKMV
jgi:REP element-mobilizing transposase RayT